MDRYKLLELVVLGFVHEGREQYDALVRPEDGVTLESDGSTIWIVKGDQRQESTTMAYAVDLWLKEGKIAKEG